MDEQFAPSGTVPLEGPEPPPPPAPGITVEEVTTPPPAPLQEQPAATEKPFIISEQGGSGNPFIPKTAPSPYASQTVTQGGTTVVAQQRGPSIVKRIFTFILFLLIIAGLGIGGKFVYGLIAGSKPITLTYWGLWEDEATIRSILTTFETTHPKIKVTYVKQSQRQYRERLQSAIDRGEGPDIFRFHNTWVPMLRSELAPAGNDVMTVSEFTSTFYPVAANDLVGGQYIYGIPMMIDGLGLYYNEDQLASAGVTPPVTWPDVLAMTPKLTVRNETGILTSAIALGTTGNVEHFSDILAIMMMQNGARLTSPIGTQAEQALLFYRKFSDPSDPVYTWNDSMDNSVYAFAIGKVAMILAPSWRVFEIKQINPSLRFKIIPIPQLPGNTVTWASYWVEGVSAKSKYQKQAWELIRYMTGKDVLTKLYTEESKSRLFGEPYSRIDMANLLNADPYVGAYIQQAGTARSFPLASRTFDNGINDRLIKYLLDAVNAVTRNGAAPSAALATAAQGFNQVLNGYGLTTETAPTTNP